MFRNSQQSYLKFQDVACNSYVGILFGTTFEMIKHHIFANDLLNY